MAIHVETRVAIRAKATHAAIRARATRVATRAKATHVATRAKPTIRAKVTGSRVVGTNSNTARMTTHSFEIGLTLYAARSDQFRARARFGCVLAVYVQATMWVAACGTNDPTPVPEWSVAPSLPVGTSNNAVAAVQDGSDCVVYSAMGIDKARSASAIHRRVQRWRPDQPTWETIEDVPSDQGRVAASAVGLRGKLYVLGGYSVGPGSTEVSFDAVHVYDATGDSWSRAADLPIPIDDAVVAVWRDRWIVVVSGWSNTGNVDAVQIYDVEVDDWMLATAFPGAPVFGHAGAISGDHIVVVDGAGGPRFDLFNQAWLGELNPQNPTEIVWTSLGEHVGAPRYRAAAGLVRTGTIWIHGGTSIPYNYDGLSYRDATPSPPLETTLQFDVETRTFSEVVHSGAIATMDHRALAVCDDTVYVVGGMVIGPQVTGLVQRLKL